MKDPKDDIKGDIPFKDLDRGQLFFVKHGGPPLLFIKCESFFLKKPYATLVVTAYEKWMGSENYVYTSNFRIEGGNDDCWLASRKYKLKPDTPTSPCFLNFLFDYRPIDGFVGGRRALTGVRSWMQMIESKSFYDLWQKKDLTIDCPCTPSETLKGT